MHLAIFFLVGCSAVVHCSILQCGLMCAYGIALAGESLTTGSEVAIKLESTKTKFPQLAYEYKLYKILQNGGIHRVVVCTSPVEVL